MKFLRSMLDRFEPHFTEGRLKLFYPLYEAADTFLYTPGETAKSGAFIRDSLDLKRMMSMVLCSSNPGSIARAVPSAMMSVLKSRAEVGGSLR